MKKIIIILSYFVFTTILLAQNQVIGSWDLTPNQDKIVDQKGNFTLTKSISTEAGVISGYADSYWASFDVSNSWSLVGTFKTSGEINTAMLIAGNRSILSGWTGWDFMLTKDGQVRFMVTDSSSKGRTLISQQRFDDSKQHSFILNYNAEKKEVSMIIDAQHHYSGSCIMDVTGNPNRFFYIGAQPNSSGGKTAFFKGELKDFVFKGSLSPMGKSLETLDKEMAIKKASDTNTLWVEGKKLTIQGMGWDSEIDNYTRLPNKFRSKVTPEVWSLSRNSAGISVHFNVTGTAFISSKWDLRWYGNLPHMTPQGVNGLDLYVKIDGKWVWAGVGKPTKDVLQQESLLKGGFSPSKIYECMVYLPLYSAVSGLHLGFSPGATVTPTLVSTKKPLVIYGTSIVHGCSASRTGMSFPSMLGRKFDMPVINLGFSGNGLMEEHFGEIMGDIDASAYIIDCLPNLSNFTSEEITARTLALVRKLRQLCPTTPIILVEDRTYAYANLSGTTIANHRRTGLKAAYDILIKETANIQYVEGDKLLGEDTEATVDGTHPSDLGMYRYFIALEPVVSKVLH